MTEYYADIIKDGVVIGKRLVVSVPSLPATTPQLTKLEFMRRFTHEERISARQAAKTDPILDDGQRLLDLAQDVRVDDPDTIRLVEYMAAIGVIDQARVSEILSEALVE